ncbi:hypothetical protein EDB85DRAFT_672330 [Lactarius pseudohatsudake]|nr:hypothetical protein EDB85DRAFT_672330 [Lactarius pseudohatsudake]
MSPANSSSLMRRRLVFTTAVHSESRHHYPRPRPSPSSLSRCASQSQLRPNPSAHQRGGFPLIHDTLIFHFAVSGLSATFPAATGGKWAITQDVPTLCRRSYHRPAVGLFLGPHRAQAHPLIGSRGLGGIDDPVRPIPFLLPVCSALVLSRCLNGVLSGNLGVIKSMIAELPGENNIARGFSLLSMARAAGHMTGSFIGGVFSRPQDHWPDRFSHPLWVEYPYSMPYLVAAAYTPISFFVTAIYLEETLGRSPTAKVQSAKVNLGIVSQKKSASQAPKQDPKRSLPLLTRPVLESVSSYAMLALLDMAAIAFIPLVCSQAWRARPQPGAHRAVGVRIRMFGRLHPIHIVPAHPRATGTRARLLYQRP